ncbi:MAG TPA: DUF721 domain-containing protein, partial [Streptomyces sp.]|nr:DUF721 domain-containing protein [Streptomyces sp.]
MTDTPRASGADLARQALAAARANARLAPQTPRKNRPAMRPARGERADPHGLAGVIRRLSAEQGWIDNIFGGSIIGQWPDLCPQYAGLVQPVHYDDTSGRLDLRPSSHTYAAQLRLLGGQLAKQINDKMGRPVVRTIRVLPVGPIDTSSPAIPEPDRAEPEAPVKTRDTASPGYRAALEAALTHRPERQPGNPYIAEAAARQEAALRAHRLPETEHRDAHWERDRLAAAQADHNETTRRAAIARARHERANGETPRRLFGA